MSDILRSIMATKREEIAAAKAKRPMLELAARLNDAPPVRDFVTPLVNASRMGLIAEVKKASPSAGIIRADFDPVRIAAEYASAGANCLSCLTDEHYFQGHLDYLTAIREVNPLPIMRKDFLLDRYQILEARVAGADCVLLIAECLADGDLRDLSTYAEELGMARLIELYEPNNLPRVLNANPSLVGVNNRNLRTFETKLEHTLTIASQIPEGIPLVSESGIRTREDVDRLVQGNARAILVGESLMRADDISEAVRQLVGDATSLLSDHASR